MAGVRVRAGRVGVGPGDVRPEASRFFVLPPSPHRKPKGKKKKNTGGGEEEWGVAEIVQRGFDCFCWFHPWLIDTPATLSG